MLNIKLNRICFSMLFFVSLLFSFQMCLAQTNVSGNVEGRWTVDGSPYYVTDEIVVAQGDTLIIDAGVEVFFLGTYRFRIDGLLQANGHENYMITFHGGGAPGSWRDIAFMESATPGCVLNYCIIKNGGFDDWEIIFIVNNDTNVTISNCEIYNGMSDGINIRSYLNNSNGADNLTKKCEPNIINNSIHHNQKNGIYVHADYRRGGDSNGYNNKSIASPLVKNNLIYANGSNGIKCFVYAYSGPWYFEKYSHIKSRPKIQKNTIYGNGGSGIYCSKYVSGTFIECNIEANPEVITSNIFSDNSKYGLNANNEVSVERIKYNNFWNSTQGNFIGVGGGLGELVKVNMNGDSCDFNWNIFLDPQFVDEANYDFHLKSASPCINAGDLSLGWDIDSTFPDIGALYYDPDYDPSTDVISFKENQINFPVKYILNQNYPNPFNPETSISFQVPKTSHIKIEVFNLLGYHIRTLVEEEKNPGSYQILWNGIDDQGQAVSSGVYLYKMQAGNFTAMKKMVLVR